MSRKVMVLPKNKNMFDMDNVTVEQLHTEFNVPKGLLTMAAGIIPNLFDIGKFKIDVPMFDLKKKTLRIRLVMKDFGGEDKYQLKLKVSFGEEPHEVMVTTDGGETWKTFSYSGPKTGEYETPDFNEVASSLDSK